MTIKGVQFVADASGKKTGVLIDLRRHRQEWEDLYDAIYGSLFYRYVFGIKPISPAQARNLVDTLLIIKSR